MKNYLNAISELVPDMINVLRNRYLILQKISLMSPVGRRTLSSELLISERKLRTEIEFLKQKRLITVNRGGMSLTENGETVLRQLADIVQKISGVSEHEKNTRRLFWY